MSQAPPILIDPDLVGSRMSLEDFDRAETAGERLYELGRGVIAMVDVPNRPHLLQVHHIKQQLYAYSAAHPDRIHVIAGGSDCKILIAGFESERHPDVAVYLDPPDPGSDWSTWVPQIVFEVVSESSRTRDYHEKPEEYLAFGVTQYLVVDAAQEQVLVHRRAGGRWALIPVKPGDPCPLHQLPDFQLDLAAIFAAAKAARD